MFILFCIRNTFSNPTLIGGEGRLLVKGSDAGGENEMGRLHIAVALVYGNQDRGSVHFGHSNLIFLLLSAG